MSRSKHEEQAFARLLEDAQAPRDLDERRMRALVSALERDRPSSAGPSPVFATALREQLLAAAAVVAEAERAARVPLAARASTALQRRVDAWRRSFRVVAATGMAALLLLGTGAAFAGSRNALPGNWNYGLKRAHEGARLALTRGDLGKGTLNLDLARRRLDEVARMTVAGVREDSLYVGTFDAMDSATITGSELLIDAYRAGHRRAMGILSRFAVAQRHRLSGLIDRVPTGARSAARDSVAVLIKVNDRAVAIESGCPCPANPLEPVVKAGTVGGQGPCACDAPDDTPGRPKDLDPSSDQEPGTGSGGKGTGTPPGGGDTPKSPGSDTVPGTDLDKPVNDAVDTVTDVLDGLGLPTAVPSATGSLAPLPAVP